MSAHITDKELHRHLKACESAYKFALLTQERWVEKNGRGEQPDWIAETVDSAHDNWAAAVLAVLRGPKP